RRSPTGTKTAVRFRIDRSPGPHVVFGGDPKGGPMVPSRVRPFVLGALAMFLGVGLGAVAGHAACDPTTDPDRTDVANARAAIAANCICLDSVRHGAYV